MIKGVRLRLRAQTNVKLLETDLEACIADAVAQYRTVITCDDALSGQTKSVGNVLTRQH